ncbi:MAG: hypothetical protein APR56_00355 [Methanosaeta sp. SDB]|nr:MAG: hypothetical protein APR56_00355 [Methanosaeta sp. SDB]
MERIGSKCSGTWRLMMSRWVLMKGGTIMIGIRAPVDKRRSVVRVQEGGIVRRGSEWWQVLRWEDRLSLSRDHMEFVEPIPHSIKK